jgi:hypothetical protein
VIALDRRGNLATPFNTTGMFRGYVTEDGRIVVKLFGTGSSRGSSAEQGAERRSGGSDRLSAPRGSAQAYAAA